MRSGFRIRHRAAQCFVTMTLVAGLASSYGQATPSATNGPAPSRVDVYLGYGYFHPFTSDINNIPYASLLNGGEASVTGYFNRHFGLQGQGFVLPASDRDNDCVNTAQAGPVYRLPEGRFVPYLHVLGGAAEVGGPAHQTCNVWGWGATAGGGVDYILPFFHDRLAIRPIQADFTYSHVNNGPLVLPGGLAGGLGEIYALQLSAGAVFRFGNTGGGQTPSLTCIASPVEVYPGEPVTVSATVMNLKPAKDQKYLWTSTASPITGTEATQTIDTAKLTPGSYSAGPSLYEGKKAKPIASCTADFKVLDTEPPVISCAANRSSINSGDPVTITSTARSAQNLALTYSYTTTNGQISGDGSTAILSTAGASPGAITVSCGVVDAKGKTASATTSVVVTTPPPPPPAPEARSLCGVSFDRDRSRPDRVDNEAKGCLDDIALTMNRETGSKLMIVGNHAPGESTQDAGARALNVSEYLVKEKGIDGSRIELRIGAEPSRTVTNTLVPPGATADAGSSVRFDPASIRRRGEAYPASSGSGRKKAPTQ